MKTRNILLYFISLIMFCSCQDILTPADENTRQEDAMYEESAYAHGLLMYGYSRLPYITTTLTDVATDDAVTNQKNGNFYNYQRMATGSWAADNDPMSQWNSCKDGIQYVNKFLTVVDKVKWSKSSDAKNAMFIDRLKGEALTLRAILYYHLLMAHGGYANDGVLYGVPLLLTPEDASSDFDQKRATFAKCVKQCFDDCDAAIDLLPLDYNDIKSDKDIPEKYKAEPLKAEITGYNLVFGIKARNLISARVAKAVKAQVALLAASPAFRDQSDVTSAQAADLCAEVLGDIGGLEGFDNTGNIWYKNKTMLEPSAAEMPEILWREDRHKNATQELNNFPPSVYGNGIVNPSQNLVDAFPMRDGRPIKGHPKYNDQDPYANRDPRLADNILYHGTKFRNNTIQTGNFNDDPKNVDDNINHGSMSTRTGYYLKKLLRDDVSPNSSSTIEQQHIYARIRYTEIFLAYAEAANDAWGPDVKKTYRSKDGKTFELSAYEIIKKIRQRAGLATNEVGMPLPEGDVYLNECATDKEKMAELIRNERRIELCFENKRFWDIRRWKLEDKLNEPVRGVYITRDENGVVKYDYEKADINPVEVRLFDKSYQFYGPIPLGERLKWSNLMQNKGWE